MYGQECSFHMAGRLAGRSKVVSRQVNANVCSMLFYVCANVCACVFVWFAADKTLGRIHKTFTAF